VARVCNGDPSAYAPRFPESWKASTFGDGKYPDPSSFASGHVDPTCPKPQPSYAQVASACASRKGKKNKNSSIASKVAVGVNSVPFLL